MKNKAVAYKNQNLWGTNIDFGRCQWRAISKNLWGVNMDFGRCQWRTTSKDLWGINIDFGTCQWGTISKNLWGMNVDFGRCQWRTISLSTSISISISIYIYIYICWHCPMLCNSEHKQGHKKRTEQNTKIHTYSAQIGVAFHLSGKTFIWSARHLPRIRKDM